MTLARLHGRGSRHVALGRPLHDHGHGLDHGLHGGGARHRPADTMPRFPRSIRRRYVLAQHGRPADRRDGARGSADVEDPDRARRSRTRSASTARSAARPMPSFICWRSPAASASICRSTTGTGSASDVPCLVNLMPSGEFLMEDFYYAGGVPAVVRELRRACCIAIALTVNGKTIGENVEDAPMLEPRGHLAARRALQAAGRHRRPARQSRARAAPCSSRRPPRRT